MRIDIPFCQDMKRATLDGIKSCTSRTRRFGKPGDTFTLNHVGGASAHFMITSVKKLPIKQVADTLYRQEGFKTPEDFKRLWRQIHPITGYRADTEVYVHYFRRIPAGVGLQTQLL